MVLQRLESAMHKRIHAVAEHLVDSADFVDEAAGSLTRFLSQCFEHVAVNGHLACLRIRLDGKFALKCLDLLFCSCVDCPGASQQRFKLHAQRGGSLLRIDLAQAAPLGRMRGWDAARPVVQWSVTR